MTTWLLHSIIKSQPQNVQFNNGFKPWNELPLEIKVLHRTSYFIFLKRVKNFI